MLKTVTADGWWPVAQIGARLIARATRTYEAATNRYGAVSVWINGERLGVKPDEFEIVEFCEMQIRRDDG